MREKYLWMAIAVLTALTLGQACYIYEETAAANESSDPSPLKPEPGKAAYSQKAADAQWDEFRKWRGRIQGKLDSGAPLLEPDFDAYFDDRYFAGSPEPFAEMERVRRRMAGLVGGREMPLFESYWDKWFEQRMRMGRFATETVRAGTEIVITIKVPGLEAGTADVNITADRIKVSFTARSSPGKTRPDPVVMRESSRRYIKMLPVPYDADAATGKTEVTGELVKIEFQAKKSGR